MRDAVVSITPEERLEMQAIVLDSDKEGALALVNRLLERISAAEKRGMSSPVDK